MARLALNRELAAGGRDAIAQATKPRSSGWVSPAGTVVRDLDDELTVALHDRDSRRAGAGVLGDVRQGFGHDEVGRRLHDR